MSGKRVPIISGVILTVTERWQVNSWVEDKYYVDSNGIMINNQWYAAGNQHQRRFSQMRLTGIILPRERQQLWMPGRRSTISGIISIVKASWRQAGSRIICISAGDDGAALIRWHKLDPPDGQG